MSPAKFKRIILKISGEGLCKTNGFGLDSDEIKNIAREAADVAARGVQVGVVIGGGNFIRGGTLSQSGQVRRATGDYMGMLATCINGMALQDTLEEMGVETRMLSEIGRAHV